LPTTYGISGIGSPSHLPAFLQRLAAALARGLMLVQLREPDWPEGPHAESLRTAFLQVLERCHAAGARLLINSMHPEPWWHQADGVHLRTAQAVVLQSRPSMPSDALVGVSAHTQGDITHARKLGAVFAVLGAVLSTPSHPGEPGLGWAGFAEGLRDAGLPVFALGGQSEATRDIARPHGAHGIAGFRAVL
jgi:8-oxo-dGTP diphosphatase